MPKAVSLANHEQMNAIRRPLCEPVDAVQCRELSRSHEDMNYWIIQTRKEAQANRYNEQSQRVRLAI